MKLHEVKGTIDGQIRWCGPAAVSIITGCRYDQALELIKEERQPGYEGSGPMVKGTHLGEVVHALRKLGYTASSYLDPRGKTFAAWLRQRSPAEVRCMFLVSAGHHWMVVQGRKVCCGQTKVPVFLREARKRRASMAAVYLITESDSGRKPPKPKFKGVTRKPAKRTVCPKTRVSHSEYRAFLNFCKEHGFTYQIERDTPDVHYIRIEGFPGTGSGTFTTLHYNWAETLRRAELCIADPEIMDGDGYTE